MKIKYISIVFFLFTYLSCNDSFMERIPKDQLSDESFWKVEDDVVKYTTSIYRYIPEPGDHSIILDAFTDNAAIVHVSHDQGAISAGTATASNSWFQRVWAELYKGVRRCNVFFENIDDVTMSEDNRSIYKGEVEYMRAFFYATLLKFYGGVPIITHPMELNEQIPPRDSAEDVYKFIISECNHAIAKLPVTRDEVGRATKGAAIALKVHISFLMKDYTETISSVEELNKLNKYDLFPNYKELFTADNENNIEVIFDMQYMDKAKDFKNGSNFDRFFTPGIFGGWEACSPSQNIVDEFECIDGEPISSSPLYNEENPYVNRDLRLDATILRHGSKFAEGKIYTTKDRIGTANATRTGYSLRKHLDPTNDGVQFPGRINYIVFRYAEILLNYAYAMNELNGPVEAVYNAVDRIRVRVDLPKLKRGLNKEEMRDAIRHERRVEFAFEGKHLFDLNSWKTTEQAVEKPTYGKRYNGERFLIETRKFDPNKQYLWAIPLSEIDLSNGVLKQNPGY